MAKYRKKPVVIEAIKWDGTLFTLKQLQSMGMETTSYGADYFRVNGISGLVIKTLEGQHIADLGDWIIQGVKGEFYPVKNDIFLLTYEPVGQLGSE